LENKITGRESQGACRQDEMISRKPPVVKWLATHVVPSADTSRHLYQLLWLDSTAVFPVSMLHWGVTNSVTYELKFS
jgi:hypothetical protein